MKKNSWSTYQIRLVIAGFIALAVSTGILINSCGQFILPIHEAMGYKISYISLAFSLISAGIIFTSPFVAKFIDRYNPKKCMIASASIISLMSLITSFTNEIWQLYVCTIVIGLAFTGLHNLPVSVMINEAFSKKNRGLAFSIVFSGSGIGGMVFNPLLNTVLSEFGWRAGFVLMSAIYILCGVLIFFLVKNQKDHVKHQAIVEARMPDGYQNTNSKKINKKHIEYKTAIRTPAFARFVIGLLILCGIGSSTVMHTVPYLVDIGISPPKAAFLMSIFMLSLAICKIVLGLLCDNIGIQKSTMFGLVCYLCGLIIMLMLPILPQLYYIFFLFGGFGLSVATVTAPIITSFLFGNKDYTKIFGSTVVFTGLGISVMPSIMGGIFDFTGSYTVGWSFLIFAIILVIILYGINFKNPPNKA